MTNKWNPHAVSEKDAVQQIREQAGIKFDPAIVEIFVEMMPVEWR